MWSKRSSNVFCSIAAILAISGQPSAGRSEAAKPIVGILPFEGSGRAAVQIQSLIVETARSDRRLGIHAIPIPTAVCAYPTGYPTKQMSDQCREAAARINADILLIGRILATQGAAVIEARIFNANDSSFTDMIIETVKDGDYREAARSLASRVAAYLSGALPRILSLIGSRGTSFAHVNLEWRGSDPQASYALERAALKSGPWRELAVVKGTSYHDEDAEEGILFWYRVTPIAAGMRGMTSECTGYRKPRNPKSLTVDEIMSTRNKPWPQPATQEEREREERHLVLFRKYYESYFMMSFIFLVGRIYVNSGDLLVYRDIPHYHLDPANRTVYFSKPGVMTVKFFSKRFYRFWRDMYFMNIPFEELLPRVMANSFLFCVRAGESETRLPDGRIRYLPHFNAVGMGTEYHRDYAKWRGNSIMFATSDEDLYRQILEAARKGY